MSFTANALLERKSLATGPRITRLKVLPSAYASGFDTNHFLPASLGLKVAHAGTIIRPWVPDHNILDIIARHDKQWLAIFQDGNRVGWRCVRRVHAVGFAGKRNGVRGLSLGRWAVDLVRV